MRLGHENAAAESLLLLARDPQLRSEFGQRGQKLVRENFAVEQMVAQLTELYTRLTR